MPAGNPNLYFASRPEVGRQFHAASQAALCTRLIDNLRGRAYIFQVLYLFFMSISLFKIVNSFYLRQPYVPGVHRAACVLLPSNLRKVLKTTRTRLPTSHPITTKCPPNIHPMPTDVHCCSPQDSETEGVFFTLKVLRVPGRFRSARRQRRLHRRPGLDRGSLKVLGSGAACL